jgi:hypothetical protein
MHYLQSCYKNPLYWKTSGCTHKAVRAARRVGVTGLITNEGVSAARGVGIACLSAYKAVITSRGISVTRISAITLLLLPVPEPTPAL